MGIEGNNRANGIAKEAAGLGPGREATTVTDIIDSDAKARMGHGVVTKTHDDHSHPH